jgi:hypothetical protein
MLFVISDGFGRRKSPQSSSLKSSGAGAITRGISMRMEVFHSLYRPVHTSQSPLFFFEVLQRQRCILYFMEDGLFPAYLKVYLPQTGRRRTGCQRVLLRVQLVDPTRLLHAEGRKLCGSCSSCSHHGGLRGRRKRKLTE